LLFAVGERSNCRVQSIAHFACSVRVLGRRPLPIDLRDGDLCGVSRSDLRIVEITASPILGAKFRLADRRPVLVCGCSNVSQALALTPVVAGPVRHRSLRRHPLRISLRLCAPAELLGSEPLSRSLSRRMGEPTSAQARRESVCMVGMSPSRPDPCYRKDSWYAVA
jgi:hypothetical protein